MRQKACITRLSAFPTVNTNPAISKILSILDMCYLYIHNRDISILEYKNVVIELLIKQNIWCDMKFNEQLRQLRESKNLTQEQMAARVGIAKTTFIGYEKGEREPRLSELKKMAHVLGMTIGQICMETDSRSIDESLILLFEAVQEFNTEEKQTFSNLVEALVTKHHADKARELNIKKG
jgi:transcriptional regulator with XRE-family HTH domain